MNTYLKVKDLIKELKKYDPNLPCIVTHDGKGHHYGVTLENIEIVKHPYFGNDMDAEIGYGFEWDDEGEPIKDHSALNIGVV